MSKIAVVYWSSTGNTEAMAKAVAEGAQAGGAEAVILEAKAFGPSLLPQIDGIAFGCPAMGDEILEEEEFEPMWSSCSSRLGGKKVALFGSYGWGDGEWMRNWEQNCAEKGIELAHKSVICCEAPGEEELSACRALGSTLA